MPPDLTISIINHSNPALLRNCLRSIYAATRDISFDIWVVDNATDRTGVAAMQEEFPAVRWLFNTHRQGFSANHNQALCRAAGRYACILNDDTIVHDGAFETLIRYMDAHREAGMAGAKLLNPDGTQQDCVYRFPRLRAEPIQFLILPKAFCPLKGRMVDTAQAGTEPVWVDWVLGACLIVRADAMRQIGFLDEALSPVACVEEVDWCYRAHLAGRQVAYCPEAVITHIGGQSIRPPADQSGPDSIRIELYKALFRFYRKHHGLFPALALLLLYALGLPWNVLMLTQGRLRGRLNRQEYMRQLWTGYHVALLSLSLPWEKRGLWNSRQ